MNRTSLLRLIAIVAVTAGLTQGLRSEDTRGSGGFTSGKPEIRSMSALAFGPDGTLFVGDGKGGAVFAIDLEESAAPAAKQENSLVVKDIEQRIAALLGTRAADVMIHDMAASPISGRIFLAVSRGRAGWDSSWLLPNDIADANVLLRVDPSGEIDEVVLDSVRHARATLPNPVDAEKTHMWKEGISLRADTITDMAYADGTLFVAGLSNEEFASTMWRVPYPFEDKWEATTLEVFHGAHGEYETHAPIRTFVPYVLKDKPHLLAAYLCTPLVVFDVAKLQNGGHVRGRTVAEFGSGNYPLDMVLYKKDGKDRILIANSNLPFMIVDPADVAAFDSQITEAVEGYVAGVNYEIRSGTGVQQMTKLNDDFVVALRRLPGGTLNLVSVPTERF